MFTLDADSINKTIDLVQSTKKTWIKNLFASNTKVADNLVMLVDSETTFAKGGAKFATEAITNIFNFQKLNTNK